MDRRAKRRGRQKDWRKAGRTVDDGALQPPTLPLHSEEETKNSNENIHEKQVLQLAPAEEAVEAAQADSAGTFRGLRRDMQGDGGGSGSVASLARPGAIHMPGGSGGSIQRQTTSSSHVSDREMAYEEEPPTPLVEAVVAPDFGDAVAQALKIQAAGVSEAVVITQPKMCGMPRRWVLFVIAVIVVGGVASTLGIFLSDPGRLTIPSDTRQPTMPGIPTGEPTTSKPPTSIPTFSIMPSSSQRPSTSQPSTRPTASVAPSTSPSSLPTVDRFAYLAQLIVPMSNAAFDPTTVQYMAVDWLAHVDPAALALETTSFDIIRDRFVLAVIYFATNGEEWRLGFGGTPWMTALSVCAWEFVRCSDGTGVVVEIDSGKSLHCTLTDFSSSRRVRSYHSRCTFTFLCLQIFLLTGPTLLALCRLKSGY
jgi:hypothetical protein